MKQLLLLFFVSVALTSCIDCGPQRELTVQINFLSDSLQLDSVSAVNVRDQQVFKNEVARDTVGFHTYFFPISLLADSTTYLFYSHARTDTLMLFYEREFRYKGDCGFIVNAQEPLSGDQVRTTFKNARVEYGTYVDNNHVKPLYGPVAPGISVLLDL